MLYAAAEKTDLDPLIVRVAQLTGGPGGAWATNEWYPIMVQSAPILGCFPDDPNDINFLPFEIAASALLDFRKTSNPAHTVHLVHPRPVSWHSIAAAIASELSIPLVPFLEWLETLEKVALTLSQNTNEPHRRGPRVVQLIPFFRAQVHKTASGRVALRWPDVEVREAVKGSLTLADPNLRQVGADDVKRWLGYWRKVGFLSGEGRARL